ncbi:hypothetical protein BQ8794_70332 [Mesorhizobium prunaredense]|uniref:Uncharacterized protein n=1 Tax=Mesorhizobium prunaredense TaxID=1631249 RepID=A0A1R3VKH7_9HYPH|nr:hypothetical protein BQ8794_70332 [Mesorhizobium prunaredense]
MQASGRNSRSSISASNSSAARALPAESTFQGSRNDALHNVMVALPSASGRKLAAKTEVCLLYISDSQCLFIMYNMIVFTPVYRATRREIGLAFGHLKSATGKAGGAGPDAARRVKTIRNCNWEEYQ